MCTNVEAQPGKFEGEPCITRVLYDWAMDGAQDVPGSLEDGTPDVFFGPFTHLDTGGMCQECADDVVHCQRLELYEDSSGFCHVEVIGDDRE